MTNMNVDYESSILITWRGFAKSDNGGGGGRGQENGIDICLIH